MSNNSTLEDQEGQPRQTAPTPEPDLLERNAALQKQVKALQKQVTELRQPPKFVLVHQESGAVHMRGRCTQNSYHENSYKLLLHDTFVVLDYCTEDTLTLRQIIMDSFKFVHVGGDDCFERDLDMLPMIGPVSAPDRQQITKFVAEFVTHEDVHDNCYHVDFAASEFVAKFGDLAVQKMLFRFTAQYLEYLLMHNKTVSSTADR